ADPPAPLVLYPVSPRWARPAPAPPTRPGQSRRGPLPGERAVPVFRGAERREAHLLDHLPRAPGRHPAGQGNAARSARVATDGSVARHTAATTATPAAPERASDPAVATVMPPAPRTGPPARASRAPARATTSRAAASCMRTWIMVAPPATAPRHAVTGSRPLRSAASVITIKRTRSTRAMAKILRGLRGATTATANTREAILEAA